MVHAHVHVHGCANRETRNRRNPKTSKTQVRAKLRLFKKKHKWEHLAWLCNTVAASGPCAMRAPLCAPFARYSAAPPAPRAAYRGRHG
eukprot:gene8276-biopygen10638